MKQSIFKTFILLVFLSIHYPLQAQYIYPVMGKISQLSNTTITVMDTKLQLSPTVKIYDRDGKTIPVGKLTPGVKVGLETIRLDGKLLVERIHVLNR